MSVYGKVVSHGQNSSSVSAAKKQQDDDEWDTDPDFVVNMSEKEQRKGGAVAARNQPVNVEAVRAQAKQQHDTVAKQEFEKSATRYGVQLKDDANLRQNMGKNPAPVDLPKPARAPQAAPVVPSAGERQKFWDQQNAEQQKKATGPTVKVDVQGGGASTKKSLFEQKAAAAAPAQPAVQASGKKWTPPPKPAASAPAPAPSSGGPKWKPPTASAPAVPPPAAPPAKAAPPPPAGGPPKSAPPSFAPPPPVSAPPPAEDDWGTPAPAHDDWSQPPVAPPPAPSHDDWSQPEASPAPAEDAWGSNDTPAHDDYGHQEEQPAAHDDWSQQQAPAQDDWGQQQEHHEQHEHHEQPAQDDWSQQQHQQSDEPQCRAVYDFQAENEGDLSFVAGDIITIVDDSDVSGWWQGRDANGYVGAFPSNLVERI